MFMHQKEKSHAFYLNEATQIIERWNYDGPL